MDRSSSAPAIALAKQDTLVDLIVSLRKSVERMTVSSGADTESPERTRSNLEHLRRQKEYRLYRAEYVQHCFVSWKISRVVVSRHVAFLGGWCFWSAQIHFLAFESGSHLCAATHLMRI
jgi:hypothetical protein